MIINSNFCEIAGRTLLRLNATKLQSLGVNTPSHWYVECNPVTTLLHHITVNREYFVSKIFMR